MSSDDSARPEPVRWGWRVAFAVLTRLPQGALSRTVGHLADLSLPRLLRRPLLGLFARVTGIDVSEAERPLADYHSVNDLFVRRLKPGARDWPSDRGVVASPVDGIVGQCGPLLAGTLLQAKGHPYRAAELLGDVAEAQHFDGGSFLTLYLSPRHYHRIHAPVTGGVRWARHVPGALLPVSQVAVRHVSEIFVRNERLAAGIDTALGPVALVAVGAYNVGRISAAFDPAWSGPEAGWISNRAHPPPPLRRYYPHIPMDTGDDFMAFHLGSTVILLLPPSMRLEPELEPGLEVHAGRVLARPTPGDHLVASDAPHQGSGTG
jgi:phosphatidylserine decarboxylase